MKSEAAISIIIVTYNSEQFVLNCLRSIFSSILDSTLEVIIIDNNSRDFTKRIIKDNYKDVVLLENSGNVGFATANNQGCKIAKGKYILLLNPDTEVSKNALEKFYYYMENKRNENVWCVGGQLVDENGSPSKSYGRFPNLFDVFSEQSGLKGIALKISGKKWFSRNRWIEKSKNVPFVMGCNMFIRKDALEEVGYFNESFYLNYEEVELSWRAKQKGYINMVLPEVKIKHYSGKSFGSKKDYLIHLWFSQVLFFKITRNKIHFNLIKGIHLLGAMLRFGIKRDNIYLHHIKNILAI